MNFTMKRLLCGSLAALMLLSLVGCQPADDTGTTTTTTLGGDSTTTTAGGDTDTTTTVGGDTDTDTTTADGTTTTVGGGNNATTTKKPVQTTTTTKVVNNAALPDLVKIWTENALTDVFETSTMPANAETSGAIHMLKNEAESIQVAIRPEDGELTDISVTIEPVAGLTITAYQIASIRYSKPSALIGDYTRGGAMTEVPEYYMNTNEAGSIKKGTTLSFCVEAVSTASTKTGTYKTNMIIRTAQGVRTLPLTVRVYNGTLPEPKDSEFDYVCWTLTAGWNETAENMNDLFFDAGDYNDNFWKLMENYAKVMKKERQNVIDIPLRNLLGSSVTIKSDGTYEFDWTNFDRFVETFLKYGSFKYLDGSHIADKDWYINPNDPNFPTNAAVVWVFVEKNGQVTYEWQYADTEAAETHLRNMLTPLYAHLKEKGWDKMWLQNVADEVQGMKPKIQVSALYDLVHELMPTCLTTDAGTNLDTKYEGRVDVPVPRLDGYSDRKEIYQEYQKTTATRLWFYTCDGPQRNSMSRLNDFPLLSTRALGWYAWQNGIDGYLHWAWNRWTRTSGGKDLFTDISCAGGPADAFLVYPDAENLSVLEGTRSTAMRDAIEDNELMRLAAKKDQAKVQSVVDSLIRGYEDFERDPEKYLQARIQFLEMLG